jgi:hypothetical protein
VDVVVSRYQGDKKVSSQPYTLSVNTGRPTTGLPTGPSPFLGPVAQLRIGTEIPVTSVLVGPQQADGKNATPTTTINYRRVGTQIDCSARPLAQDNRFEVQLSIEETTIAPGDKQPGASSAPVFATFTANNNLLMRDGQTREFAVATDRITGEIVKLAVTVKVVK